MASRKSRNIYISKYFMAVRNCIFFLFFERYVSVDLLVHRRFA